MEKDYFFFWKEMKERASASGIFEVPPYNLKTNYSSNPVGKKVYGYFGVAHEQAQRWYFNLKNLSYFVENPLRTQCLDDLSDDNELSPECLDCREYTDGIATNQRPSWWRK